MVCVQHIDIHYYIIIFLNIILKKKEMHTVLCMQILELF